MAEQETGNRPAHSIRYGAVGGAIWRNRGENGEFHNATFTRHYRDGENWKKTDWFREATLSKVALDAHTAMQRLKGQNQGGEGE